MAKVISSLLVGIGFDLDKKSADKVGSGIDSIKSKALRLGGIVAGAFGVKALTSDFAEAKDNLGKFAQVFGVTANKLNALGHALTLEDGSLGGLMSQLEGIERFRSKILVGGTGFLSEAEKALIDTDKMLKATDAAEAYLGLADKFQKMSKKQRINAADAMGLDSASIRLLSKGRAEIEKTMKLQSTRRPITDEQLKIAMEYKDEFQKLTENIGGFADKLSTPIVSKISSIVMGMNEWIQANKKLMDSGLDTFIESISTNAVAIGASLSLLSGAKLATTAGGMISGSGSAVSKMAGGGVVSGLGSLVSKMGGLVRIIGGLTKVIGGVGFAGTVGYAIGDVISGYLSKGVKDTIGEGIANILSFFGNREATAAINSKPIIIKNVIEMDGQVIAKKVQTVVGGMADQAIQDLKSTEGG